MEHKVFIHSNSKQMLGALVSRFTMRKYSKHNDKFGIEIINSDSVQELARLNNKTYLREGKEATFDPGDLQSFTLTRFMPPELMHFQGRSVVVDPDVFSVGGDVWELLGRDMAGAAIMCRKQKGDSWATSVMLLDNAQLGHWSIKSFVDRLLSKEVDYRDVMSLKLETVRIAELGTEWNSFDVLNQQTKLLHNTLRVTQPWRAGLKIDFIPKPMPKFLGVVKREWIHTLMGRSPYRHREHPDPNQTKFFFSHLREAIEVGEIKEDVVRQEVAQHHIRPDAFKVLDRISS